MYVKADTKTGIAISNVRKWDALHLIPSLLNNVLFICRLEVSFLFKEIREQQQQSYNYVAIVTILFHLIFIA